MTTFMLLACLPPGGTDPDTVTADLRPRTDRYDWTRPVAGYRRPVTTTLTAFARQLAAIGSDDVDVDLDACDLPNRLTAWRFLAEHHNADLISADQRIHVDEKAQPSRSARSTRKARTTGGGLAACGPAHPPALPITDPAQLIQPRQESDRWRRAGGRGTGPRPRRYAARRAHRRERRRRAVGHRGRRHPRPPHRGPCSPTGTITRRRHTRSRVRRPTSPHSPGRGR